MPATQEYAQLGGSMLLRDDDDVADVVAARAAVTESLCRAPFWAERFQLWASPRHAQVPLAMLRRTTFDCDPDGPYEVVAFVHYDEPAGLDDTPW